MIVPGYPQMLSGARSQHQSRARLQRQAAPELAAIIGFEQRLVRNLYALARSGHDDDNPRKPFEAFLTTACRCLRQQWREVTELLEATSDPAARNEILEALALFPTPTGDDPLEAVYNDDRALRGQCFAVWRRVGRRGLQARVNAQLANPSDATSQAAAVWYAAESCDHGPELFRDIYADVSANRDVSSVPGETLLAALWGGLLRGDGAVETALTRAIETREDAQTKHGLLKLAALGGYHWVPSVLGELQHADPATAMRLLGVWGGKAALPLLADAMRQARATEAAALSWWWITGETLPRCARLAVIDDDGRRPLETDDEVPDADYAVNWYRDNADRLGGGRLILGTPADRRHIAQTVCDWGGEVGDTACALLALVTNGQLCLDPRGWSIRRHRLIARFGIGLRPAVPDTRGVDAWGAGHFA